MSFYKVPVSVQLNRGYPPPRRLPPPPPPPHRQIALLVFELFVVESYRISVSICECDFPRVSDVVLAHHSLCPVRHCVNSPRLYPLRSRRFRFLAAAHVRVRGCALSLGAWAWPAVFHLPSSLKRLHQFALRPVSGHHSCGFFPDQQRVVTPMSVVRLNCVLTPSARG